MQLRRNAILGRYDSPIWKDWIAWLTLLGLIAAVPAISRSETTSAYAIDLIFALIFQFALFGLVPTAIRKTIRNRRSRRATQPGAESTT